MRYRLPVQGRAPTATPGAGSVGPCAGDKQQEQTVECTKGCDKHRPAIVVVTAGVYQGIARLAHHAPFFLTMYPPYFFRKQSEKNANWKGSGNGLSGHSFRVRRFFLTMYPPHTVSFYGGSLRGVGALPRDQ